MQEGSQDISACLQHVCRSLLTRHLRMHAALPFLFAVHFSTSRTSTRKFCQGCVPSAKLRGIMAISRLCSPHLSVWIGCNFCIASAQSGWNQFNALYFFSLGMLRDLYHHEKLHIQFLRCSSCNFCCRSANSHVDGRHRSSDLNAHAL